MVEKEYLRYPAINEEMIGDRNKSDGFARLVTSVYITWFFIQRLVRWQRLNVNAGNYNLCNEPGYSE